MVIPGSEPPRTVWKPQPRRPIADRLGLEENVSATRGRQGPIPASEIAPYIYNSDNLGTKTVIPQVETAPHVAEAPSSLAGLSLTDWGSYIKPAHPGEDRFPFPD